MRSWYKRFIGNAPPKGVHFRRGANVAIDLIMEQFKANVERPLPWFVGRERRAEPLIIVGGAPSMLGRIPDIRKRRATTGARVWALNNAWRPLVEAKIKPDAIVIMDARPDNVAFVQDGPDCEYLIASMAHPSLFDALEGRRVTVWHADQTGYAELEVLSQYQGRAWCIVPGGGTVGLRAMMLGPLAGHRDLHIYGMDSSYHGAQHHAYEQKLNDADPVYEMRHTNLPGKYRCAGWMARQADEFVRFRARLVEMGVRIWVHGEGLIPDLSRFLNRSEHARAETVQSR